MARLFGTDGVRGLANDHLTPELAMGLASAAAVVLGSSVGRTKVVVGRDPRASGEMLENAVVAGLTAAGADAIRVGVLPTPAVAFLTDRLGADFGIMLSASHNAMPDNGFKIFAAGGHKLDDAVEDAIEAQLALPMPRPTRRLACFAPAAGLIVFSCIALILLSLALHEVADFVDHAANRGRIDEHRARIDTTQPEPAHGRTMRADGADQALHERDLDRLAVLFRFRHGLAYPVISSTDLPRLAATSAGVCIDCRPFNVARTTL